jgi:inorganic phosphate transporter, PiT family
MPLFFILIVGLALVFDFLNGVHGSSNIVGTMITSRAFRPSVALMITAVAEFTGPFLYGVAVAHTIGSEIVQSNVITLDMLLAALISSILWNLLTWINGIPSSSSHSLVGGLIGAAWVGAGIQSLLMAGMIKIVAALFAAPLIGFGLSFLLTRLVYILAANSTPRINQFFKQAQLITALVLATTHGANDAQKTMGIIVLAMVISGMLPAFTVPLWVVIISAAGMALGTLLAGWHLIRVVGTKFYKIRPVHSFSAQLSSAIVLVASSMLGWPVSATHIVSSAIVGSGSSERLGKIHWGVAGEIVTSWILTIPASIILSAGIYWLIANYHIH